LVCPAIEKSGVDVMITTSKINEIDNSSEKVLRDSESRSLSRYRWQFYGRTEGRISMAQ
jgi:hypothetical protein